MSAFRNYKYLWSLLPGLMVIFGNIAGGWWVGLNAAFSLGILAILENFVPEDKDNSHDKSSWFPDLILYMHVIFQIVCLFTLAWTILHFQYTIAQIILLSLSNGVHSGSSSLVVGHELMHRKDRTSQWMAKFLFFTAGNIYFFPDHLRVHHKWVGTDKDPASCKYGESLYGFYFRGTIKQIKSAFTGEVERLRSKRKAAYGVQNYLVGSLVLQVILWFTFYQIAGITLVFAYLLHCIIANFLLEYTNYIEHYGLSRTANEKLSEELSWQTDKVISRFFLVDLSRHSDHHFIASKPYHTLSSHEKSPVLPGGYVSMIYYALIPPVFFNKINPIINRMGRVSLNG